MPPIFASPDIAALVAALPPLLPTKKRPSLVRSFSGDNLLDSRKVLARFRALLENNSNRIKKSELPSRLGIETADWLLACYDGDFCYSKDGQALISKPETQDVVRRLRHRAMNEFVEIAGFASENDVARQSCIELLHSEPGLRHFPSRDGRVFVGESALVDRSNEQVLSAIEDSDGEMVDLTSLFFSIPFSAMLALAEDKVNQRDDGGSLAVQGERITYVPADYQNLQERKQEGLRESRIAALLNDLVVDGYSEVAGSAPDRNVSLEDEITTLASDVAIRFRSAHDDVEVKTFDQNKNFSDPAVLIVAKVSSVEKAMQELNGIIQNLNSTSRSTDFTHESSLRALETKILEETSYLGLTKRLLASSEHRALLESSLASAIRMAEDRERESSANVFRSTFVAPLELYCQGLQAVLDPALNERLSQYICEHFRNEVLPGLAKDLRNANWLDEKARAKDFDRLTTICAPAMTAGDLQAAASKFCRKQKITMPDHDQLNKVKREVLHEKLKHLQKMSRGSDILQNLIWILLAHRSDGLFMSAGKDTSRMIKLYQSIGDTEKGQRLEHWRDVLKKGDQSDMDLQQMKDVATGVIESTYGKQDGRQAE